MADTELHVSAGSLRPKQVLLMISFFDPELSIPEVTTVVYLGKDIFHDGSSNHYFQRYELASQDQPPQGEVIEAADDHLENFYDFGGAARLLELCAIRHRRGGD